MNALETLYDSVPAFLPAWLPAPWFYSAVIVVGTLFLLRLWLRPITYEPTPMPAYSLRPFLMSRTELSFYGALRLATPPEIAIFASVRLADVIQPRDHDEYRSNLNRIIQKQLDFLLCDAKTSRPLLAIELQDRSHNSEKRRQRDEFVSQALHGAGLPLLLVRTARIYAPAELKALIEAEIGTVQDQ